MATTKSRRDFRKEATRPPYTLALDAETDGEGGEPRTVTFADPNKLPTRSAYALARETDPEEQLRLLLGNDFEAFWSEWSDAPLDETNALIEDVFAHFGAPTGKQRNSRA